MLLLHFTITYRAAIHKDSVSEPAVSLGDKFNIIGALQNDSLIQAASLLIQVGDAVPAVVGDVLGSAVGQQAHEGKLSGHFLGGHSFCVVFKLQGK